MKFDDLQPAKYDFSSFMRIFAFRDQVQFVALTFFWFYACAAENKNDFDIDLAKNDI